MANPETVLVNKIIKALKQRGGFWFKVHGSAFQTSGIPDIVGCYQGRFIGFEVKLPETAQATSMRQRLMLKRIYAAGGIPRVITSAQAALGVLERIDRQLDREENQ